jgi:hypothetical protein
LIAKLHVIQQSISVLNGTPNGESCHVPVVIWHKNHLNQLLIGSGKARKVPGAEAPEEHRWR